MAFLLGRFDVIKQNYNKTGLYAYNDTVGAVEDPSSGVEGDLIAAIIANDFFNSVADVLQVPGALILITATDGAGIYKVTQVYDGNGDAAVQLAYAGSDLAGITATVAEINQACDKSTQIQTMTASGAITAGVQAVYLNHTTVAIAATIADAAAHQGLFLIKAGLEPGAGQDHTCVLTSGTFDGTNDTATFADIDDFLLVYFDASGNGTILVNNGSVVLS